VIKGTTNREKYAGTWLQQTVDTTNADKTGLLWCTTN